MLQKINIVNQRFDELNDLIIQPDIISDQKKYVQLTKEYKDIKTIVDIGEVYKSLLDNISEAEEIISTEKDLEMIEMAKLQLDEAKKEIPKIEEEIKVLLIPKDPDDTKNVVVELRAGAGGDEASIFAGDLYRMYTKYCEGKGWKINLVDYNEGTSGGYKEIIFEVSGTEVYGTLKFEAGVHRVQRVPQTETQGRVHTSAASVIVLPEAEEFEVELDMQDVRIERTTSTGPGGQSVNTTYSAIKLHHEPTGMIVSCQDQKSSHKNLEKALKVLRSRLYEIELAKKQAADSAKRKSMVSSGDRSAKIRTYNYSQGRVTDHRIGLTLYDLSNIINGDIQKLVDELMLAENTEILKASNQEI
ncbi:peptide chain release factor 1 [Flavobacteriaceae bacterium]|jgi:peptide chain release factor 1|nr:peptide chain release factor 1 [bacterium]MDA9285032.1 peptide chain release factor 1 [Flavobacteriaceae bacterium]MDB4134045.1 peptide chain release factor 1 [Flavobacteriaceae bacterium]MDC0622470.1 peptide chain release factor 1 [Flavobacteriaceae bacterium]MDC1320744.1 peptide chain release factor 1 [Flavobacteriaceae bacterium]